ncbi:MAG: hypothetical protein ABIP51_18290 [Bacteroidia bacterium]
MLPAFLAFGGIIFYCILTLLIFIICITLENDKEAKLGAPLTTIILSGGVFWFFYRSNLSFELSTKLIIIYSIAFLFIGILWSFFKWLKFVKFKYKKYLAQKNNSYPEAISSYKPIVSENKEQITAWILLWPFSVLRYSFVSLLGDLIDQLILKLTGIFNKITDSQFKPE